MVTTYAVSCLPYSLNTALSLLFPDQDYIMDPIMLTILHTLCGLQFSINFIIYTIMPSSVRDMHVELFHKMKTSFFSLCKHQLYQKLKVTLQSMLKSCILPQQFGRRKRKIVFDIQQLPDAKLQKRVLKPKRFIIDFDDSGETYLWKIIRILFLPYIIWWNKGHIYYWYYSLFPHKLSLLQRTLSIRMIGWSSQ